MAKPRRFTDEEVIEIRRNVAQAEKYRQEFLKRNTTAMATKFKAARVTIQDIVYCRTYTDVYEDLWEDDLPAALPVNNDAGSSHGLAYNQGWNDCLEAMKRWLDRGRK